MNKLKLLIPLLIVLINSGCASFGPTVRIETSETSEASEPVEDFVVVCGWYSGGFLHGSGSRERYKVFIAESGEEVDCGLGFEADNQVQVMHPLYTNMEGTEVNGITVVRTKNKLQILDKQKEKFEAGFWRNESDPLKRYFKSLPGCGFPHQYFDYYNEVKNVDMEYFEKKYNDPIYECHKRQYPIIKVYDPYVYGEMSPLSERMRRFWDAKEWKKFK